MGYTIWPDGLTGDAVELVYKERGRQEQLKATGKFKYSCADAKITHSEAVGNGLYDEMTLEEFATGCDADETWARSEGQFGFAVFSQNLARALRNGSLTVAQFLQSYCHTDVIGGSSHLRVKKNTRVFD